MDSLSDHSEITSASDDESEVSVNHGEIRREQEDRAREVNYWEYLPLYKAAIRGDWEGAKIILERDEHASTAAVNESRMTALHVAVRSGKKAIQFVEELVKVLQKEELLAKDVFGCTALHMAARVGNREAAAILLKKNPDLLYVRRNGGNVLPATDAAFSAERDTLCYLLTAAGDNLQTEPNPFPANVDAWLLNYVIQCQYFDVALDLVQRYPHLATEIDRGPTALQVVSLMSSSFLSGSHLRFWERVIYNGVPLKVECYAYRNEADIESPTGSSQVSPRSSSMRQKPHAKTWKVIQHLVPKVKQIKEKKLLHHQAVQLVKLLCNTIASSKSNTPDYNRPYTVPAIVNAAMKDIPEVIEEIEEIFPEAIWSVDRGQRNIFQLAVVERCENVFNLAYQMSDGGRCVMNLCDRDGNNILHLAARLAPQHKLNLISGALLQMQRELQWYKGVEKFVNDRMKVQTNAFRDTPQMVFTKAHRQLLIDAKEWVEDTRDACIPLAILLGIIVFAAAIVVSRWNKDNELPILFRRRSYLIFTISDAVSLVSSTTSLLTFLAIRKSQCAEGEFLLALPRKLIIGLVSQFLSIAFMLIAISAAIYLAFGQGKAWIIVGIAVFASIPVTGLGLRRFGLLLDVIRSTYGPSIFCKKSDRLLY